MRELRLVLLGLAALISFALSATFIMRAFRSSSTEPVAQVTPAIVPQTAPAATDPKIKAARGRIERAIADAPDYTKFFDRLRLVFPSEYESILNEIASANADAADVNIDKVMMEANENLRHRLGQQISGASDEALDKYFAMQSKEVQALGEKDSHLCVVFAGGGQAAGFLNFWADHRPLISEAALAGLDAMNSGRTDQIKRGVPSDDDLQVLEHALVDGGLTRPEIAQILDDTPANPPIADDRMCKAQGIYMTAIAGMPADLRARLYALLAGVQAKS